MNTFPFCQKGESSYRADTSQGLDSCLMQITQIILYLRSYQ